jgi:hypothetical protein
MRPRITVEEARFIVETLAQRKEEIEALRKRREELSCEVYRLREQLHYDTFGPVIKEHYFDKKAELQWLEAQSYRMYQLVSVFDSLMAKYSRIAEGRKTRGRYKSHETAFQWKLPSVLENEPKPV